MPRKSLRPTAGARSAASTVLGPRARTRGGAVSASFFWALSSIGFSNLLGALPAKSAATPAKRSHARIINEGEIIEPLSRSADGFNSCCFRRLLGVTSLATPARYETPLRIVCVGVVRRWRRPRVRTRSNSPEGLHTRQSSYVILCHNGEVARCRGRRVDAIRAMVGDPNIVGNGGDQNLRRKCAARTHKLAHLDSHSLTFPQKPTGAYGPKRTRRHRFTPSRSR